MTAGDKQRIPVVATAGGGEVDAREERHAPESRAGDLTTEEYAGGEGNPGAARQPLAIETCGLVKRFGKMHALDRLDLQVPHGAVYALLGRNGAGKSTLIQLLLGLLEPSAGSVRVLGLDPVRQGLELRRRIGYIPEQLPMYEWMTVEATVRLVAELHPGWSVEEERQLLQQFRIPGNRKIRELSRGSRALLALVMAMSYNPELVLLDECTSGMDPVFRREFDRSVIDALHDTGRTVLFASHQIRELERICDWVGIVDEGRMLIQMPVEDLRSSVKMLRVTGPPGAVEDLTSRRVVDRRLVNREWLLTIRDYDPLFERQLLLAGIQVQELIDLDLEEIFIALLSDHVLQERRLQSGQTRDEGNHESGKQEERR